MKYECMASLYASVILLIIKPLSNCPLIFKRQFSKPLMIIMYFGLRIYILYMYICTICDIAWIKAVIRYSVYWFYSSVRFILKSGSFNFQSTGYFILIACRREYIKLPRHGV
jgi:hypothetical protein